VPLTQADSLGVGDMNLVQTARSPPQKIENFREFLLTFLIDPFARAKIQAGFPDSTRQDKTDAGKSGCIE
jgi:hypothetical protein